MIINFQKREVNTILGDVIKHMTPDRAYEDYYPQLQAIVTKVMAHMHDFSLLFSLVLDPAAICHFITLWHGLSRLA